MNAGECRELANHYYAAANTMEELASFLGNHGAESPREYYAFYERLYNLGLAQEKQADDLEAKESEKNEPSNTDEDIPF